MISKKSSLNRPAHIKKQRTKHHLIKIMMNTANDPFKAFEPDLEKLKPELKEQVLRIAQQLLTNENYEPQAALGEATRRTEERFLDEEG